MSDNQPPSSGSLPLSREMRIDAVCDRFEAAWKAGQWPRIEDYLGELPELEQSALFSGLIKLELEYRCSNGQTPTQDEYKLRFPDHIASIEAAFEEGDRTTVSTVPFSQSEGESALPGPVESAKATESPLPDRIGRYKVIRRIGGGTFGTVYLAHDELADRLAAIKVPSPKLLATKRAREEFLRELRSVAQLRHEGIVIVHDFGEQPDGPCYIVYEYIDGMTLAERMKQGRISCDGAASIVAQVADALYHAHSKDVFHRDVKPANIVLDKKGRPRIVDFGLAVREQELADEKDRLAGTYPYMSPEQVRGRLIDGRSDIFSLGVIFYELLCGRRPFVGKTKDDLFEQIKHREARPPRQIDDSIPAELERICLKTLSKEVVARFSTANDFAAALRKVAFKATSPTASRDAEFIRVALSFERIRSDPRSFSGARLGHYVVHEWVAKGGTGLVFCGANTTTGQTVCIKVFHPCMERDHEAIITKGVSRAVRGLSALNHPSIIRPLDFFHLEFMDEQSFCLVTDFIKGKPLDAWNNEVGSNPDALLARFRVALAITEALLAAHESRYIDEAGFECVGVLHGDIKPANIIVRPDGTPVLVDFLMVDVQRLLAKTPRNRLESADGDTDSDSFGTPGFMPPEQESGRMITVRSDVFGLGQTLRHLFLRDEPDPHAKGVMNCLVGLNMLLLSMTDPDPDRRPMNMQTIRHRLLALSEYRRFVPEEMAANPEAKPTAAKPTALVPTPVKSTAMQLPPTEACQTLVSAKQSYVDNAISTDYGQAGRQKPNRRWHVAIVTAVIAALTALLLWAVYFR